MDDCRKEIAKANSSLADWTNRLLTWEAHLANYQAKYEEQIAILRRKDTH